MIFFLKKTKNKKFGREEACKRDEEVRERDEGGTFLSFSMGPSC